MPFDDTERRLSAPEPEEEKQEELPLFWTFFLLGVFAAILAAIDLRALGVVLVGLAIAVTFEHHQRISNWFASWWTPTSEHPIVADF